MSLREFAREMPKVELHVHLEGSIRPSTLLILAERNGIDLPARDLSGLRQFYRFTDFEHFLRVYFTISACLKTTDDFSLIAYEFGADLARQNVRYAEVTFTPHTNVRNTGLPFDEILTGLNDGRARARADFGVEFQLGVRHCPRRPRQPPRGRRLGHPRRRPGGGWTGTGRHRAGAPARAFRRCLCPGARRGAPQPASRRRGGRARERVGRAPGPPRRADWPWRAQHRGPEPWSNICASTRFPLEICPTSNLCLGIYPSYQAHPIRRLWEQGVYVTVNSDDPPMFNTDLVGEYQALVDHLGFTAAELERLSLNAVRASFLPALQKAALEQSFQSEFARLRVAKGVGT